MAPPFKQAEFDIMYGTGLDKEGCMIDVAIDMGVIQKSGSWYSYNDSKIAQGRDNVITYLQANPEIFDEISKQVKENMGF